ncbi:unnamed protein product [Mytilus edulis]|uniref:ALOG domain-containing protein n=1 Tax=Mytilus edulis TaxID=6550 RepID=A0A8S3Q7D2_MYTED|nr:unnamed protein product [Mytilus edulis]
MLLDKEISEFSAEMYLELIMTYNNDIHYDELHSFKEEEDLRTLSVLKLKNRLEKSLSVSIAKVEKMLKRELESSDLIRLCHIGIELANANSSDSRRQEKKRKSGNDDSSPSKKISGEPTIFQQHTCDNCASREMSFREEELNDRILELDSLLQSTKYSKQKLVLQKSIVSFLSDLNPQKSLNDALPSDIRKFLVYKDDSGKTQIHKAQCKNRGVKGKFQCGCPLRLSAGSVDSLIGQLRAIFRDHGRGTDWNDMLGLGNPAASSIIKVPISYKVRTINGSRITKTRNLFNILSFTGDRAGDLGSVLTDQVRWLPGEEGVIISMMKGKTIDISDPRVVIIYNSVNTEFCPVTVLRDYIEFCKVSKLEIVGGYLFRPLAPSCMALSDVPFTSAAANARLKSHLTDLNIWEGETPHSTRSGCALTLTWLGLNSECIKSHVGWKSDKMLKHYTTTQLKAEIELLKKGINVDVIEQALREVKEYAARSREINVDTLQLKLMHLDEVARRELSSTDLRVRPYAWEYSIDFLPALVNPRLYNDVQYVDVKNILVTQDMRTFDCNKDVLDENLDEDFYFLDPSRFVAGNVHKNTELWGKILDKNQEMKNWIENFVDINNFMQPFKGIFWNVKYNNDYPPTRIFKNASNCEHHVDFINTELLSRLRSGAISYLGKLGEVKPPHCITNNYRTIET